MEKKRIAHLIRLVIMADVSNNIDAVDIGALRFYLEGERYLTGDWLPTKKAYKLLKKYGFIIPKYREQQEEFNRTGKIPPLE